MYTQLSTKYAYMQGRTATSPLLTIEITPANILNIYNTADDTLAAAYQLLPTPPSTTFSGNEINLFIGPLLSGTGVYQCDTLAYGSAHQSAGKIMTFMNSGGQIVLYALAEILTDMQIRPFIHPAPIYSVVDLDQMYVAQPTYLTISYWWGLSFFGAAFGGTNPVPTPTPTPTPTSVIQTGAGVQWYEIITRETAEQDFGGLYLKLTNVDSAPVPMRNFVVYNSANTIVNTGNWSAASDGTSLQLASTLFAGTVTLFPRIVTIAQQQTVAFFTSDPLVPTVSATPVPILCCYRGLNYTSASAIGNVYKSALNTVAIFDACLTTQTTTNLSNFVQAGFTAIDLVVVPSLISPLNYPAQTLTVDSSFLQDIGVNRVLLTTTYDSLKLISNEMAARPNISTFLRSLPL